MLSFTIASHQETQTLVYIMCEWLNTDSTVSEDETGALCYVQVLLSFSGVSVSCLDCCYCQFK